MADLAVGFGTPFEAQIAYLRAKLRLPTERWDDIQAGAHDRAFVVAGVAKADLLSDLHQAVIERAADGAGLQAFRKDFRAIVAKHGWTGYTGEGTAEGFAWRTKVIYQTNMATAYAAGRWRQMTDPAYLQLRPYWRYLHSDHVLTPRPLHVAWHGLTLRHDHPFWATHFPPAGWEQREPRTGAPVGIDKGWGYAPGAGTQVPLRQLVQDKLITYPPAIGRALSADVNRYLAAGERASAFATRVLADSSAKEPLWLGFVEDAAALGRLLEHDVRGFTVLLPADAPRHAQASHGHDGGDQRPPVPADYDRIADVLNAADDVRAGRPSRHGRATVVATKTIGGEQYRAVFELLPGKANRALGLVSLVVKVGQ